MEKIRLYRDKDGKIRCNFRGMDMPVDELNIPLLAQLYKQLGQLPKFAFPLDDRGLAMVADQLTQRIKQTAMMIL